MFLNSFCRFCCAALFFTLYIVVSSRSNTLSQVEYATKAASKGGSALALKSNDFSVFFGLRKKNPFNVISQPSKVRKLTEYYGVGTAGIISDANYLTNIMFDTVLSHQTRFDSDPPISKVASQIAGVVHSNTMVSYKRPFGVSLCLFGYDIHTRRARVFEIDTLGGCHDSRICCIGKLSHKLPHMLPSSVFEPLPADGSSPLDCMPLTSMISLGVDTLKRCTADLEDNDDDSMSSDVDTESSSHDTVNCDTLDICVVGKDRPFVRLGRNTVERVIRGDALEGDIDALLAKQ